MSRDPKTQFINYMTLQRFALSTKKNYLTALEGLTQFLMGDVQQLFFRHCQFLQKCVQVG
jgi:hypothetical protein